MIVYNTISSEKPEWKALTRIEIILQTRDLVRFQSWFMFLTRAREINRLDKKRNSYTS
jgi:hypothetical protein